jgi:hypothetical protein
LLARRRQGVDGTPSRAMTGFWVAVQTKDFPP